MQAIRRPVIVSSDPLAVLQAAGRLALERSGARVVAVTGATGKTTTKDILVAMLRAAGVAAEGTPGNRNTEVGVPMSLLGLAEGCEVAVVEMGMRGPGQIAALAALAPPEVACVTSIGPVHLELLGTVENVAAAKAELLLALRPGGTAVVPDDEPLLEPHIAALDPGVRVIRVGAVPDLDLDLNLSKAWELRNAAAALACCRALGLVPPAGASIQVEVSALRGQERPLPGGGVLIEDCYNANPIAMRAALADLAGRPGRRVAVLADMMELGPDEGRYHREIGAAAAAAGIDLLIGIGDRATGYVAAADGMEAVHIATVEEALEQVPPLHRRRRRRAAQGLALHAAGEDRRRPERLMERVLISAICAATLLMFLGPKFIEWLRANEVGQFVRPPGMIPKDHAKKQGTPTMGGVLIIVATTLPFIILSSRSTEAMLVLFATIACGAIGFVDDFMKIVKKRSLGLSGRIRMVALLGVAAVVVAVAVRVVGLPTTLVIPVWHHSFEIGVAAFFVVVFLVVAGAANAVNLTDGLDGLAAGIAAIVLLSYTAIAFVADQRDLAIFGATLGGACVGFLWFNSFPAAVFMGDTGSYALGGGIAAMAVMTKTELLLVVIGAIFVAEALSVIIQVLVFKRFRRRVFLMTPVHHHFEMAAWSETKIIVRFWLIAAIFAAVGFTLFFRDLQNLRS